MTLSEFCIRRPVFSSVISMVLIIIGLVSFTYLSVRQYPQIERPVISVITSYEGAGPEIIESQITKPLEGVLAGIEGVDYLTSRSESENSVIKVFFKPERDIDAASADVRDRIGRVRERLPKDAPEPIIKKADADSEPTIHLALTSNTLTIPELFKYADKRLKDQVQAVSGVASVDVYGSAPLIMHVWLDPIKMAAYLLTVQDVDDALEKQNVEIPAGRLIGKDREYQVTTSAKLKNVEAFNNMIILERDDHIIRLKDIGYAEFSPGEERSSVFFNNQRAIGIDVIKKSTANPLDLVAELTKNLPKLRQGLPAGAELTVAYDTSIYIRKSIDQVYTTLFEAVILVIAVVWIFLWSARGALIPVITIPVSLIATFSLMFAFGFTINMLTLLALVLAIGLVVDDAIVMLENIYRHIEEGMAPMAAAIKGSKEIAFAVIAMTITLAAVYAPIALSEGTTGKIFSEFAITLAGAVIISGVIALTLTPMMCARMLRNNPHSEHSRHALVLAAIESGYGRCVSWAVQWRWIMLGCSLAIALLGGFMAKSVLKSELSPKEDEGIIYGIMDGEQGTSLEFLERYSLQMDAIFQKDPNVVSQLTTIRNPTATSYNILKDWGQRKETAQQIVDRIKYALWDIPGADARASSGGSFFGGSNSDTFSFVVQTTLPYEDLSAMVKIIEALLQKHKGFDRVFADIRPDSQEYYMDIDRDKLSVMGLDVKELGKTLDSLISGRVITKFRWDGEQYDIKSQLITEKRADPNDLNHIFLRAKLGKETAMVPLINVVDVKFRSVPTVINHFNQLKSITVSATMNKGMTLSDAVAFLEGVKTKLLTDEYRTEYAGQTRQYLDSQYTIYIIFALALCFIYLVMAAQFESFVDPFIIMFSVPLSLTGALVTLWLVGGTLNIFSQIGLVTLIGLITKHGIMIVDFANKLRQRGHSLDEAIVQASKLRLRPILMTTAAMVLGAIPLATLNGAGAAGLNQIGWVIVGGMTFGTVLTLFVIPGIYVFLSPKIDRRGLASTPIEA